MGVAKRQKFQPENLLLLLSLVRHKYGKPISWQGLATQVLLALEMDEGQEGGFADTYLDKLYKEAKKALSYGELLGKDITRIDTLTHYLGFSDYSDYVLRARRLFDYIRKHKPHGLVVLAAESDDYESFYARRGDSQVDYPVLVKIGEETLKAFAERHARAFVILEEGQFLPDISADWLWLITTKNHVDFNYEQQVLAHPYALEMAAMAWEISEAFVPATLQVEPQVAKEPLATQSVSPWGEPAEPNPLSLFKELRSTLDNERPPLVDAYFFMARLLPTIFLCLPMIPLLLMLMQKEDVIEPLQAWPAWVIWPLVPIVAILVIWGLALFLADSSKRLERKYFGGRAGLPTTYLLTFAHETRNGLSKVNKRDIRTKIEERFGIRMPTEQEEQEDPDEAAMIITDALLHVRQYMGRGRFIFKQSVRYGFYRVFLAGSWLGCLLSVATLVFALTINWYFIAVVAACGIIIYGRWWIWPRVKYRQIAEDYAHQLLMEFAHFG